MQQEELRKKVRIAKALNEDIFYKDFAEYLEITEYSFYNWLHGYYNLSRKNHIKLNDIVSDLID